MSQVLEWVCFYYIQCAGCTLSIQRTLGDKMKDESARKKHKNKWCMRWNTGKSMKFVLKKNRSIILLDEKCWCVHTHIIGTQYYMYLSHIHSMNVDQLNWSFFYHIIISCPAIKPSLAKVTLLGFYKGMKVNRWPMHVISIVTVYHWPMPTIYQHSYDRWCFLEWAHQNITQTIYKTKNSSKLSNSQ